MATWCRSENGTSRPLPEHLGLLELLSYFVHPGQPPRASGEADKLSLNLDEFHEHRTACKPLPNQNEFLHSEMDWMEPGLHQGQRRRTRASALPEPTV
jgi:hypothetical protein